MVDRLMVTDFERLQTDVADLNQAMLDYGFLNYEKVFINDAIKLGLRPIALGFVRKKVSDGSYEYLLMPTLLNDEDRLNPQLQYAPPQSQLDKLKDREILSNTVSLEDTLARGLWEKTGIIAPINILSCEFIHSTAILYNESRIDAEDKSNDPALKAPIGDFCVSYIVDVQMPLFEDGIRERNIVLGAEQSGQKILAWTLNQIPRIEIKFWYSLSRFIDMINDDNNPLSEDKRLLFNHIINLMIGG